jgi:hypothetical protein
MGFMLLKLNTALFSQSIIPPLEYPSQGNSSTNRYILSLPGHFYWLTSTRLGSAQFTWVKQINDIDVSLLGIQNYGNIGSSANPLRMDYEGSGNQIIGISYTASVKDRSFFTYLKDCVVSNLILTAPSISSPTAMQNMAGFSVYAFGCDFTNCKITGGQVYGGTSVSGFVCYATNCRFIQCSSDCQLISVDHGCAGIAYECVNTMIIKCSVYGVATELSTVNYSKAGKRGIGGIAGNVDANSSVIDSYCDADITWNNVATSAPFGGIAANNLGKISNCYFSGSITSNARPSKKPIAGVGNVYNGTGTPTNTSAYQAQAQLNSSQTNATSIADMTDTTSSGYSSWLTTGSWLMTSGINNNLPYQAASVYVTSSTGSGSAQDLTIPVNTTFTVNPGVALSLDTLKNYGNVLLSADANGYSQLKFNYWYKNSPGDRGTNTIAQEQYLEAGSHLISSPVSQGFTTTPGDETQLYSYDANAGNWATIGTNTTIAGLGFAARVDATQIPFLTAAANVSVTGTPNTSMTHTLGFYNGNYLASTGSGTGWNLIGNPYTCGLDWSTVTLTNVNAAFYVWDPSTSSYKYYSAGGISSPVIPPMQAFWVQATQAGASISTTMAANGTVASTPTYYKTLPDNLVITVEKVGDSAIMDQLWISNIAGTTNGFDGAYDAWKMTNGPTMPNVFTWDLGERIAVNALELNGTKVLPMGFSYANPGTKFQVKLSQVTGGHNYEVYLEDKLTGGYHDLSQEDYSFRHEGWTQEDPRFALHLSLNTVGLDDAVMDLQDLVYQVGDRLIFKASDDYTSYRIYGINGQEFARGPLVAGMQHISAPTAAGLYVIEFAGPEALVRQKISTTN